MGETSAGDRVVRGALHRTVPRRSRRATPGLRSPGHVSRNDGVGPHRLAGSHVGSEGAAGGEGLLDLLPCRVSSKARTLRFASISTTNGRFCFGMAEGIHLYQTPAPLGSDEALCRQCRGVPEQQSSG